MDNDLKLQLFTEQYMLIEKRLYLTALSILRHHQSAEDALQEAAYKAYQKISSLKDMSMFSTWITRITMNECYKILRKNKHFMFSLTNEELLIPFNFNENQLEIFERLSKLPKKKQRILILRYYHEMPLEDIAKTLLLPLSTVKSCLYRTLEYLKREWSDLDENVR